MVVIDLHSDLLLLDFSLPLHFLDGLVAAELLPHLLESRVIFDLFSVVRPLDLHLLLGFVHYVPPILLLKHLLHFSDVLVRIVQSVDSLPTFMLTSALIFCNSTSSSFSLTTFNRT
jgi:hypothetical protein